MSNRTTIFIAGVSRPIDLRTCPFCDAEPGYLARTSEDTGSGEFHALMCYCGGYSATAHQHAGSQAEVVALWNKRAPAVVIPETGLPSAASRRAI